MNKQEKESTQFYFLSITEHRKKTEKSRCASDLRWDKDARANHVPHDETDAMEEGDLLF